MVRKANRSLEQALAALIQNQATFVSNLNETNQRFARIERKLEQIETILLRHEQVLNNLPEVIIHHAPLTNRW